MNPSLNHSVDFNIWHSIYTQTQYPVRECVNTAYGEPLRHSIYESIYAVVYETPGRLAYKPVEDFLNNYEYK